MLLPTNSFNNVTSAHYIEINKRYFNMMTDELQKKYEEVANERKNLNRKEKLTKYAHSNYQYVEPQNVA